MTCETYQDLIAAHIDGALSDAERQAAEAHLNSCGCCQRLFATERAFRRAFSARRWIVPVPIAMERRVRLALAAEIGAHGSWWRSTEKWVGAVLWRPHLAAPLTAAGLLILLLWSHLSPPDSHSAFFAAAVASYHAVRQGTLALEYQSAEPQGLERSFNHSGRLNFRTHVIDLRPAGYHLRGGTVTHVDGQPLAVALYTGEGGQIMCLRQRGTMPPPPPGARWIKAQAYLYTQAGRTLIFSQFSDHFCALISDVPPEAFLERLARLPALSHR